MMITSVAFVESDAAWQARGGIIYCISSRYVTDRTEPHVGEFPWRKTARE